MASTSGTATIAAHGQDGEGDDAGGEGQGDQVEHEEVALLRAARRRRSARRSAPFMPALALHTENSRLTTKVRPRLAAGVAASRAICSLSTVTPPAGRTPCKAGDLALGPLDVAEQAIERDEDAERREERQEGEEGGAGRHQPGCWSALNSVRVRRAIAFQPRGLICAGDPPCCPAPRATASARAGRGTPSRARSSCRRRARPADRGAGLAAAAQTAGGGRWP